MSNGRKYSVHFLKEVLVDDSHKVRRKVSSMNQWTNRFVDAIDEREYQNWCDQKYHLAARRSIMLIIGLHLSMIVLDLIATNTQVVWHRKPYSSAFEWTQFGYLIVAVPFASSRRPHFKSWLTVSIVLFALGLMTQTAYVSLNSVGKYQEMIVNCSAVESHRFVQQISGVLFVSVSALVTAIAQGILSSLHVDFSHVLGASIVLLLYLTTVVLVCQITTQIEANTFVLGSFVMLSVVGHSMDRSKRLNFAHFVETQQENTILQGKLEKVAEICTAYDEYEQDEKVAVDKTLEGEFGRQLLPFRIPLDHLKLETCIGTGAFGEVIRCDYFGTNAVLKRMHRNKINEETMANFAQEILLMSDLRHPNIVQFLGASWNTYSNIGFVLEYVAGGDLFQLIHDESTCKSWSDPFHRIAVDAARGICYLHGRNILLRMYKRENHP